MMNPQAKYHAVAWDVDGTLVDSEPLHHASLLAGSLRFGVNLSDLSEETFRGVHMGDVWTALRPRMPDHLAHSAWLDAIVEHYIAHRSELVALPGVLETIGALAARGIQQVCVSNSHRPVVEANLEALGIRGLIDIVITIDDVSAGKPDPEPYRTACERLGLDPSRVLAVEDSRTGALSAHRAGLDVAFCVEPPTDLTVPTLPMLDLSQIIPLLG